MTPSAGASTPSIARWEVWGLPWMPSSTNVPSSTSSAIRSRAVKAPFSCCLSIFSWPPPRRIWARRACRSSTRGRSSGVVCSVLIGSTGRCPARAQGASHFGSTRSPSLPLRLALFEERGDALHDVLCGDRQGQLRTQIIQSVIQRHVELTAHRFLAETHDQRRLRRQLRGPLPHRGVELAGRDDLVDKSRRERFLSRPALAEQEQLVGLLAPDIAIDQRHNHERER